MSMIFNTELEQNLAVNRSNYRNFKQAFLTNIRKTCPMQM